MAGSRHHQVPQFLMRGFASRIIPKKKQDTVLVWLNRKNAEPREVSTVDVGVEEKFYNDGDLNIDDEITEFEKSFARSVNQVRKLGDSSRVSDSTLLEFVVHLTMRTKHLRDTVIDMGEFALDGILAPLTDPQNLQAFITGLLTNRRDLLMKWFDEDLKKVNASVFKKLLAKVVIKYAPAQFLMNLVGPRTVPEMAEALKEAQADLSYRLDEIAKSAHIKVLIKNLVPEPRVEYFKQLNWFVRRTSELLILGDVCCLFKTSNSRYVSIAGPKDGIERVYLPVSGDCVVVGSVADEVPEVDVAEINEASAKVSRNYFISSANTSGLVHLSRLIGTDSNVLTKAEMEEILAGVLLRYN